MQRALLLSLQFCQTWPLFTSPKPLAQLMRPFARRLCYCFPTSTDPAFQPRRMYVFQSVHCSLRKPFWKTQLKNALQCKIFPTIPILSASSSSLIIHHHMNQIFTFSWFMVIILFGLCLWISTAQHTSHWARAHILIDEMNPLSTSPSCCGGKTEARFSASFAQRI